MKTYYFLNLQCLSDELCEMMFLVPLVNGEKLDYTWRKLPEKHLFHDFMYVIKRVAMATPIGTMTRWTDENFIKVFFFNTVKFALRIHHRKILILQQLLILHLA